MISGNRFLYVIFSILALGHVGHPFGEKDFLALTHTYNGISLNYRLFVPPDSSEPDKYPLVLTLHGAGERGNDNIIHVSKNNIATVWVRDSNYHKQPCFVVSPQCPSGRQWVDTDWGLGTYSIERVPISHELAAAYNLMESIIEKYPVDTNRLYITGLSMGGYGTWDLILRYPNTFAAAIPVCGAGDDSKVSLIKDIPIWAFHGNRDNVVPIQGSRDMIKALEGLGRDVLFSDCNWNNCQSMSSAEFDNAIKKAPALVYSELNNVDHNAWDPSYRDTPQLVGWMFSHSKAPVKSLVLLTPNGGETWTAENSYDITWRSEGEITELKLEYQKEGVKTLIDASLPNSGKFTWQIPAALEGDIRIVISDASDSDISDSTGSAITVVPTTMAIHSTNRIKFGGHSAISTRQETNRKTYIFDVSGKLIGSFSAFPENGEWDGKLNNIRNMSSGFHFLRTSD